MIKGISDLIKEMEAYTKKVTTSTEKAEAFLQRTGIYTKKGNLKKQYK